MDVYLISDQPQTCPKCGSRTDFSEIDEKNKTIKQRHQCLDARCHYRFLIVEF